MTVDDKLYQEAIMRAAKAAVGAGRLTGPDATATVDNPLCGDRVTIDLALGEGRVTDIAQQVRGCVLCEAAASVLAEHAPGEARGDLAAAMAALAALLASGEAAFAPRWETLRVFRPVHGAKSRHRCVLLPFEALLEAFSEGR